MVRTVAISGASGKTGYRIAEELLATGESPRLLLRPTSTLPASLADCDCRRLDLSDRTALDAALRSSLKNPAVSAKMRQLPSADARSPRAQRLFVLLRVD
jgi:uncharacterized protein YbjT (DUF2867 family)